MHRIDTTTRAVNLNGSGKDGFTGGDPLTSTPPTDLSAEFVNALQEELSNTVEGFGYTLSKPANSQLFTALQQTMRAGAVTHARRVAPAVQDSGSFRAATSRGRTIILAGDSGRIESSTNEGVTFTQRTPAASFSGTFNGGCDAQDGNNISVLVGSSGAIQTSADGTTWTARTAAASYSGTFYATAYGNGVSPFVAVGTSGEIQTSNDATTWTHRTPAGGFSGTWYCAISGYFTSNPARLVIAGSGGAIQTSPDGSTWTARTAGSSYTGNFFSIAQTPSSDSPMFVLCGSSGELQSSTDQITWTRRTSPFTSPATTYDFISVQYHAQLRMFVAWPNKGQRFAYSADGITWRAGYLSLTSGALPSGALCAVSLAENDDIVGASRGTYSIMAGANRRIWTVSGASI